MNAYMITLWVDTELDRSEVADRIEAIDLENVQYQIDESPGA